MPTQNLELIPISFNPYKYKDFRIVKYYEKDDIRLWIKSSMRYCSCGRKTPYVYKRDYYYQKYRICGYCMPSDVKQLIELIYS
jgi:hypothetical protein